MSDTVVLPSEPQTDEEYRAEFRRILAEIETINQQIEETRKSGERFKDESESLKMETRAILASMGIKV